MELYKKLWQNLSIIAQINKRINSIVQMIISYKFTSLLSTESWDKILRTNELKTKCMERKISLLNHILNAYIHVHYFHFYKWIDSQNSNHAVILRKPFSANFNKFKELKIPFSQHIIRIAHRRKISRALIFGTFKALIFWIDYRSSVHGHFDIIF